MGFLRVLGQTLTEVDRVSVFPQDCLWSLSPLADCRVCAHICPEKAITISPQGPIIANACTGCGLCVKHCPTRAIRQDFPTSFQADKEGRLILRCQEDDKTRGGSNRIPCFASLRMEDLLGLLDAFNQVCFVADCGSCTKGFSPIVITGLLDKHGIDAHASFQFLDQEEGEGQSRRDFLAGLGAQMTSFGQKQGSKWIESTLSFLDESKAPLGQPLQTLKAYLQAHPLPGETRLPYYLVQVTSCSFCGACLHVCPTSVLSLQKEGDQVALVQNTAGCLSCGLCVKACFQGDLHMVETMTVADLVAGDHRVLASGQERVCTQCGLPFISQGPGPLCTDCLS